MTHSRRRIHTWLGAISVLALGTGAGPCQVGNPAPPEPPPALGVSIIGDANGDGRFDGADALYARDVIDDGGVPAQIAYLSDVATPCAGFVDHEDYARLRAAVDSLALGRPTPSDCHDEAFIGDEADAPRPAPEDMLPPRPPTLDDQFAAVADIVPEFGGAYVGTNGDVQVVLTAADVIDPAVDAMIAVFGVEGLPHDVFEAVDGRWGFRELQQARVVARQLLPMPGVVSVDVDEVENQVVIGLADMGLVPQLESELTAAGVDLGMVAMVAELAPSDDNAWGGEEIWRDHGDDDWTSCTFGFVARHATELGFVTNAHCGAVTGAPESSYLETTATVNLGTETAEASVFTNAEDASCPLGAQCMHADVTFVTLDPGVQGALGRITRYNGGGFYEIVQETNFSWTGGAVSKSGKTTFETAGTITATCVDIQPTNGYLKLCQDRADYDSDGGDSGSPVFRILQGTDVELHGLHWGSVDGSPIAYFSPMHQIHYELAPLYSLKPTIGNEPPMLDVLDPDDGDSIVGSFVSTTFKAYFWDFEDGYGCPTCEVVWSSSVAGYLGTTPASSAFVLDSFVLPGGVKQKIIATARDSKGDETKQAVWLYGGTSVPTVTVLEPFEGQQLWKGATYMYEGTSFDADFFGPLPCEDLEWTLPPGNEKKSGCSAENTISQTGNYSVTLTATKPGTNVSVSDTVGFQVVEPPQNVGPHVAIVRPGDGAGWNASSSHSVEGRVQDFDEAGLVDYEWVIKYENVEIVIDSGTMPNHDYTTFLWPIEDYFYVPPKSPAKAAGKHPVGCGGTTVEIELRGTDAANMTGSDSTSVVINGPPC